MFTPEGYSHTIFKDRYSLTPEETWDEATTRVAKQMALAENPDKQKHHEDKFKEILVDNFFVPGGRIWYNSGRANPQLLNCVSGDTLIHIKGGKARADSLSGEIETLSKDGVYRKATWGCYGKQELLKVVLENGDELFATPNHEWITSDRGVNKILKTQDLKGKSIPFQHVKYSNYNENEYLEGIKHGMVFGDGSIKHGTNYCEIRQFGEVNTKVLLEYFKDEQLAKYNCSKYGIVHYATKLPKEWKSLPSRDKSQSYLRGFIAGMLATDGHIDNRGHGGIYQSNLENLIEIKELASIAGIPTKSIKLYRKYSPFTGEEAPNYKLCIYKNVWYDDLKLVIKSTHRENLSKSKRFANRRTLLKVSDVVETGRIENVYCCVEPETHTMVIGNGYLTKQCFVLSNNLDSKEGWGEIARQMIVTSMTGGGCGIDFSDVRPRGAPINSQKGECPGPVELMKLIDNCAAPIRSGGQRRVALMFSLDLDHPDVLEFLNAKLEKGMLTNANVSVRSKNTEKFIKAVKEDGDWELSWKGKHTSTVKAKELWDKIVKNAYNSAEPGFLNWEMVLNESNIWYIEDLVTTNPCGEIALSAYDCCCLGHLVLPRFITSNGINFNELGNTIRTAVRFLDNVLTVNSYPLPEMKEKSHKLRRIGLGTTGLADSLAILGLKYGSEEANKFVDKLYKFIAKAAYEASVLLAVEKGAFPACNPKKHVQSAFMKRMPAKIRSLVEEHGIRNCCILTQAPTGTVSILSGNCSSGIEPMFAPVYERRYWDKEIRKTELVFHPLFEKFMNEGKSVEHFVGSHDLSVKEHMEVQTIVQKWVDNAVSKTINMAKDYPIEDMSELWLEYLPKLKGTTFYREGTRGMYDESTGQMKEPPLLALPLEEGKRRFAEKHNIASEQSMECPTGICEI